MSEVERLFTTRFAALMKKAENRPLRFRAEAEAAFAACPRQFRKMAHRLDRTVPMSLEFFMQWRGELLPRLETIQNAPHDSQLAEAFKSALLAENEAQRLEVLDSAVRQRLAQERQTFVNMRYSKGERKMYELALSFVNQPMDVCNEQIERYVAYELYREAAKASGVAVVDANKNWLARWRQTRRVRRQTRRLEKESRRRLAAIDGEIAAIEQLNGGLPARLFGLKIDLVTVLAARQEYEKALARLGKKSASSPAKRLDLYQKKTEAIRAGYLDSVPGLSNLSDVQQALKEIDAVLLAIFDLDSKQRNAMMSAMKQYRQLVREREALAAKIEE